MESSVVLGEKEWLTCCGSAKFAKEMASAGPFSGYQEAVGAASDILFNKLDVNGWLEAFSDHPQIGESPSKTHKSPTSAHLSQDGMTIISSGTITSYRHRWSKGEQSTALATATDSTLQELYEWHARYRQKFGFLFFVYLHLEEVPRRY